jgi:hypothetical protein
MKTLYKAIARASMRPCPEIIPSRVFVRLADGFEYSAGGSVPWPSKVEERGFVYTDGRSTYGKRFESENAARRAWIYRSLRNAVRFMRELRKMNQAEIDAQAAFWIK